MSPFSAPPRIAASWALAGAVIVAASMPSGAQIQGPPGENRFCAVYDDGSAMDCTFPTLALCRAAINGVGGFCQANNLPQGRYLPDRGPHLFPNDPLGLYRDRGQDFPPVPPPP